MTTASNWLLNWAIAYSTPYLVNPGPGNANLGSKVFFIWAFFCLICEYSHFVALSLILTNIVIRHRIRLFLHLRDQRAISRASRRVVCKVSASMEIKAVYSRRSALSTLQKRTHPLHAEALWLSWSNLRLVGSLRLVSMWRTRSTRWL